MPPITTHTVLLKDRCTAISLMFSPTNNNHMVSIMILAMTGTGATIMTTMIEMEKGDAVKVVLRLVLAVLAVWLVVNVHSVLEIVVCDCEPKNYSEINIKISYFGDSFFQIRKYR